MINGIENEFEFVKILNNKKVEELDINTYEMITTIFNDISNKEIIKAWRNHYKQKSDVMIKIGKVIKGISIKKGSRNSVHVEPISTFVDFLKENDIPLKVINKYLKYHYGDGTIKGNGKIRMSSYEYKYKNISDIELINKYFNKENIVEKAIERFILKGTNSNYEIDALCYGTANDYLWITNKEIKDYLQKNIIMDSTGPHVSSLFIQPQTRNLNYNKLYESKRYCIQVKWYSLFDDIINIKCNNKLEKW